MHINLTELKIDDKTLSAISKVASLLAPEDSVTVTVTFTASQVSQLFTRSTADRGSEGVDPVSSYEDDKDFKNPPPKDKQDKPPAIRRNKEEKEAGFDAETTRLYRASGLSIKEFIARQKGPDLDETPPPLTGADKTEDELASQEPMTTTTDTVTLDHVRLIVGRFLDQNRGGEVKAYTLERGLTRLSEADPSDFAQIVADLEAMEGSSKDSEEPDMDGLL